MEASKQLDRMEIHYHQVLPAFNEYLTLLGFEVQDIEGRLHVFYEDALIGSITLKVYPNPSRLDILWSQANSETQNRVLSESIAYKKEFFNVDRIFRAVFTMLFSHLLEEKVRSLLGSHIENAYRWGVGHSLNISLEKFSEAQRTYERSITLGLGCSHQSVEFLVAGAVNLNSRTLFQVSCYFKDLEDWIRAHPLVQAWEKNSYFTISALQE